MLEPGAKAGAAWLTCSSNMQPTGAAGALVGAELHHRHLSQPLGAEAVEKEAEEATYRWLLRRTLQVRSPAVMILRALCMPKVGRSLTCERSGR